MDINQQKEQFSFAYIRAVATVAGYKVTREEVDDDSVDLTISETGGSGTVRSPKLDLQAKCTENLNCDNGKILYDLKVKNYNDLRNDNVLVPRILILVIVPPDIEDWLHQSDSELTMYRCGYWVSLRGQSETDNTNTIRVGLPRTQLFSVASLRSIMDTIAGGGAP